LNIFQYPGGTKQFPKKGIAVEYTQFEHGSQLCISPSHSQNELEKDDETFISSFESKSTLVVHLCYPLKQNLHFAGDF